MDLGSPVRLLVRVVQTAVHQSGPGTSACAPNAAVTLRSAVA
jgi:hypothetical protein